MVWCDLLTISLYTAHQCSSCHKSESAHMCDVSYQLWLPLPLLPHLPLTYRPTLTPHLSSHLHLPSLTFPPSPPLTYLPTLTSPHLPSHPQLTLTFPPHLLPLPQLECFTSACSYAGDAKCFTSPRRPNPWANCNNSYHCPLKFNNGHCDVQCNTTACLYDGNDCDPPVNTPSCPEA